jgi:hypothetical protein
MLSLALKCERKQCCLPLIPNRALQCKISGVGTCAAATPGRATWIPTRSKPELSFPAVVSILLFTILKTFGLRSRHYLIDLAYLLTQRGALFHNEWLTTTHLVLCHPCPQRIKISRAGPQYFLFSVYLGGSMAPLQWAVQYFTYSKPRPSGRPQMCDRSAAALSLPEYHGQPPAATAGDVNTGM